MLPTNDSVYGKWPLGGEIDVRAFLVLVSTLTFSTELIRTFGIVDYGSSRERPRILRPRYQLCSVLAQLRTIRVVAEPYLRLVVEQTRHVRQCFPHIRFRVDAGLDAVLRRWEVAGYDEYQDQWEGRAQFLRTGELS